MQHEIPIAFAFDKNYLKTGAVALYSLLHAHRAVERIIFSIYVFYSGLNEDDLNRLQETIKPFKHFATLKCQDISATLDSLPTITDSAWVNRYSRMILVKYFLPSLFPQYSKMIWSDVDVVFCRAFADDFIALDTSESFHLSGVISLVSQSVTEGFWFCNLDYMRERSFTQQVLEKFKIQAMRPYFKEPTLIHHLHAYIKELPLHYCVLPYYYQEELDDLRHKASLPIRFEIIHQDKPNEFIYRQRIPYEISQIQDILSNPIIMHTDSAWVNRYSRMILVKYFLPSLFPQYSKMIWSDVDVVFCRAFADDFIALDTSESFHLSGVISLVSQSVTEGFWFCNLDYMRERSFTQQVLEKFKIQAMRPYFKEPTLIHHLHAYIKELPLHYCVLPYYYQEELDDLRHKASLPIRFEIIHQDKPNEFIYRQRIPYEISQIQDILSNPIIMHYESDKDALGIYNGKPWEFPLGNQYHLWLEMLAHTPFWKDFTLEMQKKRVEYRDIAQKIHYFSQDKRLYEVSIRSIKVFASHYYNLVVKERWSKPIKTFFQKKFFQKKF